MTPEAVLRGSLVELRPITDRDTDLVVRWRNSAAVRPNLFSQADATVEGHRDWLRNYVETKKCRQFIIVVNDGRVPVGTVFLKNIDPGNRKAELGIFIGEENYQGRGIGGESVRLTLDYAFSALGLDRVYLEVFDFNEAAIRSYKRAGFVVEGIARHDILRDGKPLNVVLMGCLAHEREKSVR